MPELNGDLLALLGVLASAGVALFLGVRKNTSDTRTVAATEVEKLGERLDEQREQGRQDAVTIREQNQTILDQQSENAQLRREKAVLEEEVQAQATLLLQRADELAHASAELTAAAQRLADRVRDEVAARRAWRAWEDHAYVVRRAAEAAGVTDLPEVPQGPWEEDPPP